MGEKKIYYKLCGQMKLLGIGQKEISALLNCYPYTVSRKIRGESRFFVDECKAITDYINERRIVRNFAPVTIDELFD